MGLTGDEWLRRFSEAAGVEPPTEGERDALLELAGIAAHASERPAAPLTTWLAGRARLSAGEARRLAEDLADRLGAGEPMGPVSESS